MPEAAVTPRPWGVPALLATLAAGSWAVYQRGGPAAAELAIVPYAASLTLGPALVYPCVRRAGASGRWAVACGLFVPALWLAKELHRVSAVFSAAEALYYALNPLSLGLFAFAAGQMAAAELALERRRRGRWKLRSPAGVALPLLAVLAAGAAALGRGSGGREIFYAYIALYRVLFPQS